MAFQQMGENGAEDYVEEEELDEDGQPLPTQEQIRDIINSIHSYRYEETKEEERVEKEAKKRGGWKAVKEAVVKAKLNTFLSDYDGIDDDFKKKLFDRWKETGDIPTNDKALQHLLKRLKGYDYGKDSSEEEEFAAEAKFEAYLADEEDDPFNIWLSEQDPYYQEA